MEAAVGTPDGGEQGGAGPCEDATPMDAYLRRLGLYRKLVAKDGSCLFRAVAEQVMFWGRRGGWDAASYVRAARGPFVVTAAPWNVGTGARVEGDLWGLLCGGSDRGAPGNLRVLSPVFRVHFLGCASRRSQP